MARIRLARIPFTNLQKAIFGTRRVALESNLKKITYESLVLSLLLYGSECWDRPAAKGDQKAENAEKSKKYEAKDGAKLNGVRRCDGPPCPVSSARRLGFCTISGPELVWPGGILRVVASFSSSAEGRYAPDVLQRRPAEEMWQLCSLHGPRPNEAQKRKMQWQRGRSCSRAQHSTGQARVQAGGVV